jgi:glycosyltransferase involved in cell wall biosynthesis
MMPTISVVIPAYNAENTVLETISSVQQQTFSDFELIVINDGSTDRTLELLQSVKDERLRIFSYENGGVAVARNRGISHANGEFLAFLDHDDLWTSDKLELQLAALQQHPDAGVAYSWTYFMKEKEGLRSFQACEPVFWEGNVYTKLLVGDFIYSGSNPLICRQAIDSVGEFDPAINACDDWDYWVRLAAHWNFVVVPKHQLFFRRSSGSTSYKVEMMKEASLKAIEKTFRSAPTELQYLKKHCLANFNLYSANLYLQYSKDMEGVNQAGSHLWRSIRLQPSILLNRGTQKMIIKFLLMRTISPKLTSYLLNSITRLRPNSNPLPQG